MFPVEDLVLQLHVTSRSRDTTMESYYNLRWNHTTMESTSTCGSLEMTNAQARP